MDTHRIIRSLRSIVVAVTLAALTLGPLPARAAQRKKANDRSHLDIGVHLDTGDSATGKDTEQPEVAFTTDTLRGLQGVWLMVTRRDTKAEKYGLDTVALESAIKSHLRSRGIPLLSKEQYKKSDKAGILCIDVMPLISEEMGYSAVGISVGLMQNVLLTGESKARICQATTWEQRTVALCDLDGIREIPESVTGFVDHFVRDFEKANTDRRKDAEQREDTRSAPPEPKREPAEEPDQSDPPRFMMI